MNTTSRTSLFVAAVTSLFKRRGVDTLSGNELATAKELQAEYERLVSHVTSSNLDAAEKAWQGLREEYVNDPTEARWKQLCVDQTNKRLWMDVQHGSLNRSPDGLFDYGCIALGARAVGGR